MTSRTVSLCDVRRMSRRGCAALLVLLTSLVTLGQAVPAIAADEPDLIFRPVPYFNEDTKEYFFDRDPEVFRCVLNF